MVILIIERKFNHKQNIFRPILEVMYWSYDLGGQSFLGSMCWSAPDHVRQVLSRANVISRGPCQTILGYQQC
uniref:Uncharacterized protein n=1 Tax=Arion vulgaris TaxID=1028688 RepID=A0A0B6ZJ33_9EUPU